MWGKRSGALARPVFRRSEFYRAIAAIVLRRRMQFVDMRDRRRVALDDDIDDCRALEEHRVAGVIPARDRRVLRCTATDRGVALRRLAEFLEHRALTLAAMRQDHGMRRHLGYRRHDQLDRKAHV